MTKRKRPGDEDFAVFLDRDFDVDFSVIFQNAKSVMNLFKSLHPDILTSVCLQVDTENGLTVVEIDNSRVLGVIIHIPAKNLAGIHIRRNENIIISLMLSELLLKLQLVPPHLSLRMTYRKDADVVSCSSISHDKKQCQVDFEVPLVADGNNREMTVQMRNIVFPNANRTWGTPMVEVNIPSHEFKKDTEAFSKNGDRLQMRITSSLLELSVKSQNMKSLTKKLPALFQFGTPKRFTDMKRQDDVSRNVCWIGKKEEEKCLFEGQYALKYMVLIGKATSLSDRVKFVMRDSERPIMVEFEIPDLGTLKFCLVPSTEDDPQIEASDVV